MADLMRFIPKEYKGEVENIRTGCREWNEVTRHWETPVIVTWIDGNVNKYANKSFMKECLKEFGR